MSTKRKNPYTALLEEAKRGFFKFQYPKRKSMFFFEKSKLKTGWTLDEVYQRVSAADTLGWEVILEAKDDGLHMTYRERAEVPWTFKT